MLTLYHVEIAIRSLRDVARSATKRRGEIFVSERKDIRKKQKSEKKTGESYTSECLGVVISRTKTIVCKFNCYVMGF